MRAVITGTPMQIEGEPAEIAQLVELLSSGAVMVEHVHQWRVSSADDAGVQKGHCWCGQSREFAPWGETANRKAIAVKDHLPPRAAENVVAVSQKPKAAWGSKRKCTACGGLGHRANKCPSREAA